MPVWTMNDTLQRTLSIPQVVDIVDKLPKHPTNKWLPRDFSLFQGIIIHHAASEAPIVNQANYHVKAHGWPGIAYHFCIKDNGIFQTNYIETRTTHARNANDTTIGICVVGDLRNRSITEFERCAISGLVISLREQYPKLWVKGHNQVSPTSCPVTSVPHLLSDIAHWAEEYDYAKTVSQLAVDAFKLTSRIKDLHTKLTTPWAGEAARKLYLLDFNIPAELVFPKVLQMYEEASKVNFEGTVGFNMQSLVNLAKDVKLI